MGLNHCSFSFSTFLKKRNNLQEGKTAGMGVWSLFTDNERDSIFLGTKAAWSLVAVEQNGWMKT